MELDILEEVNKSEAETNSTTPNSSTSREDNELPCSDILKLDSSDSKVKLTQEKSREMTNQEDLDSNLCSDVEIEKAGDKTEIQSSNIPIQESCLAQDSDVNESENTMNSKDKKVNVDFSETDDQTLDKLEEVNESELAQPKSVTQSLYHIKWFKWKGLNTALIMQNENGPCPLLAIINLLILSRKISIPPMQEFITDGQLMEYLGDCILEHAPKKLSEGAQLNYEQNMHDAIGIMCKLQTGLDVNVKFTGVADFEFTPECIVFDLLNIGLYHGWLVDPQEVEETRAVSKLSYNQLVEKIIVSKQQPDNSQQVSEGLIAEAFLERTASQLTYHGLCELNGHLKDDELCVFFRNNHFSTMYKHRNELFLLVTDQGFLTEEQVIWATLSNVEGDCVFVDANFRTSLASRTPPPPPLPEQSACAIDKPMTGISQEDQDYLVALSLQEEQNQSSHQEDSSKPNTESTSTSPTEQTDPDAHQEWTDLQLALQLQEEEQRLQQQQARMAQRRQDAPHQPFQSMASGRPMPRSPPQPSQENPPRASGERCVIL